MVYTERASRLQQFHVAPATQQPDSHCQLSTMFTYFGVSLQKDNSIGQGRGKEPGTHVNYKQGACVRACVCARADARVF